MDPPGRDPLLRSFERHLYAEDRSSPHRHHLLSSPSGRPTPFLRDRGTNLEAATTADLEAFMADLLARRMASTAATYHKVLKILYGWLAEEEEIPVNPMAK
jgi:site-specific recombinase XerD